jgi:hypothetical protein
MTDAQNEVGQDDETADGPPGGGPEATLPGQVPAGANPPVDSEGEIGDGRTAGSPYGDVGQVDEEMGLF